jgi:hypothetical protein
MHSMVLLLASLFAGDVHDYVRPLDAKKLDQATFDAEAYGDKKVIKRENDGLRVTLAPGGAETGWKTPQALKIGGDFTITANIVVHKLPKPAQDDGVAVGASIATQNLDQPEATLVRLTERDGSAVYRSINKEMNPNAMGGPMQRMPGMVVRFGGMPPEDKPAKPPRRTFRAVGQSFRVELRREGSTLRYQVLDGESSAARYLGQVELGANDIAGVKLFASNRNGAEAMDVVLRDLTIRADRITGLGTQVRTVFSEVIIGEPTAIEDGKLIIGPPNPNANAPGPGGPMPQAPGAPGPMPTAAQPAAKSAASTAPPAAKPDSGKSEKTAAAKEKSSTAPAKTPSAPKNATTTANSDTKATSKAAEADPKSAAAAKSPAPHAKADTKDTTKAAEADPKSTAAAKGPPPHAKAEAKEKTNSAKADPKAASAKEAPKAVAAKADPKAAAAKPAPPPKVEPKARIALGEVHEIAFERAFTLSGRVLGQPNLDFTMPGRGESKDQTANAKPVAQADDVLAPPPGTVAAKKIPKLDPKPNGICDLYVTLSNLRNAAIKQVMINAQTDKGQTAYRLDTTDSNDWPLVLRRAGTESWADLFLEPPAADLNGKNLTVNVIYADGQNANAQIKVDKKTDPKLAFDPKAPAPSLDARVYLSGDEQLFGKFEAFSDESLRLRTPWGDNLTVPLARVTGIYMGLPEHKETAESFARRLRMRGTEDLLLATSKEGEVVAISGIAERTEGDKLLFRFQDKTRSLPLKLVEGLVLAARQEPAPAHGLRPTFSLAGGLVISGLWKELGAQTWKIETAWGQVLNLPAAEIRGVRFRGGQVEYLSDLHPSKVEETPFFGRRAPWRKDVSLAGGPLKMDGRTYEHGIAVHSRSSLTYDLEGRYATFEATVGFDESASRLGRVDCRILADGKELYANHDLRADAPPVKVSVPVANTQRLSLLVDFGADQDTGDRVIWADARLFRSPPVTGTSKGADRSSRPQAASAKAQNPKPKSGP